VLSFTSIAETPFSFAAESFDSALTGSVSAEGVIGTPSVNVGTGVAVNVTAVPATGIINSVTVNTSSQVFPEAVFATGIVAGVFVWGKIDADTAISYNEIEPSPSQTWTKVTPSTGQSWDEVA